MNDKNEDSLSWDAAFRIFSVERSFPLFGLMGLPSVLIENSTNLISISRDFFRQSSIHALEEVCTVNQFNTVNQRNDLVVRAFTQVEKLYGESVSQQLYNWCIKYVVNHQFSSSLYAWETLFCHFYKQNDELKLSEIITPSEQTHLRNIIALDKYREVMEQAEEQLYLERLSPLTEWESWLENQMQYAVGDNDTVSLIEYISNNIKLVIGYHHTAKVWERLKNAIPLSEQQSLIEWAHWQAEALGIPDNFIDIAPSIVYSS